MTHNSSHHGPTLPTLSPEALAALKLPLRFDGGDIVNADGVIIFKCCILTTPSVPRWVDYDIAMFATPLLNAALTPAQPAPRCHARIDCEVDCPWRNICDDADVVTSVQSGAATPALLLLDPDNNAEAGQLDALLAEGDDRPRSAG